MSEKMVIFDCDGVLVDSEYLTTRIEIALLTPYGLDMTPDEFTEVFVGQSGDFFYKELTRRLGQPLPESFHNSWEEVSRDKFATDLEAVQGIPDVLDALNIKKSVASNSGLERVNFSLETTNMLQHFDGGIYSSSMCANGKPAPDVYLLAASKNAIDPANCVVVEDSFFGATAGKAAGMHVIGFGAGLHILDNHRTRMEEANIDGYAKTAHELQQLITAALEL